MKSQNHFFLFLLLSTILINSILIIFLKSKSSNFPQKSLNFSSWKSYTNNKSGVEFMYPGELDMFVSDNVNPKLNYHNLSINMIPIGGDPTSYSLFSLEVSGKFKNLADYLDSKSCNQKTATQTTNTFLSGYNALKLICNSEQIQTTTVLTQVNGNVYQLFVNFGNAHTQFYSEKESEEIFNQIISTFKIRGLDTLN